MVDFKLDTSGDLDLSTNDLQLLSGADEIRQHLQIRYRFFLGEWPFDTEQGIPYVQEVLKKNPNEQRIRLLMTQVALSTPGVEEVRSLSLDLDNSTRELTISMEFGIVLGGEITFEPFIVEVRL